MSDDAKIAGEKLKVFISYSRRDAADFADELVAGLELEDPILRGIDQDDPVARNPCLRRGPLSLDHWTRLPMQFWCSLPEYVFAN